MEENITHLINECRRLEEDSTYNADTHHIIAARSNTRGIWLKSMTAAVSAISGAVVLLGYATWVGWLSIVSGLALALMTALDVDRKKVDHLFAAKEFTVLKHEARSLYQAFAPEMERHGFFLEVKRLRDKYNDLVLHCPPTENKAFEGAQRRIKSGIHSPDFAAGNQTDVGAQ